MSTGSLPDSFSLVAIWDSSKKGQGREDEGKELRMRGQGLSTERRGSEMNLVAFMARLQSKHEQLIYYIISLEGVRSPILDKARHLRVPASP